MTTTMTHDRRRAIEHLHFLNTARAAYDEVHSADAPAAILREARENLRRHVLQVARHDPSVVPDDLRPLMDNEWAQIDPRPVDLTPPPKPKPCADVVQSAEQHVQAMWEQYTRYHTVRRRGGVEARADARRLVREAVYALAHLDESAVPEPLRPLLSDRDAPIPYLD